jgi:F0F1-type ATP synthase membrane subunit b/b'
MEALSGIVRSLGIDYTLFIQLPIFLIVLFSLWFILFKPYFEASLQRRAQTTGNQDEAESISAKTRELETLYQRKARGSNMDIKALYDRERLEAQQEHERILLESKDRARVFLENAKTRVQEEYNRAREELLKESPALGKTIANRLLSKDA